MITSRPVSAPVFYHHPLLSNSEARTHLPHALQENAYHQVQNLTGTLSISFLLHYAALSSVLPPRSGPGLETVGKGLQTAREICSGNGNNTGKCNSRKTLYERHGKAWMETVGQSILWSRRRKEADTNKPYSTTQDSYYE
jgi:hypothetical protein